MLSSFHQRRQESHLHKCQVVKLLEVASLIRPGRQDVSFSERAFGMMCRDATAACWEAPIAPPSFRAKAPSTSLWRCRRTVRGTARGWPARSTNGSRGASRPPNRYVGPTNSAGICLGTPVHPARRAGERRGPAASSCRGSLGGSPVLMRLGSGIPTPVPAAGDRQGLRGANVDVSATGIDMASETWRGPGVGHGYSAAVWSETTGPRGRWIGQPVLRFFVGKRETGGPA